MVLNGSHCDSVPPSTWFDEVPYAGHSVVLNGSHCDSVPPSTWFDEVPYAGHSVMLYRLLGLSLISSYSGCSLVSGVLEEFSVVKDNPVRSVMQGIRWQCPIYALWLGVRGTGDEATTPTQSLIEYGVGFPDGRGFPDMGSCTKENS